jgi:hypothetical protein
MNFKSLNNTSKWQMGFNLAFKWLRQHIGIPKDHIQECWLFHYYGIFDNIANFATNSPEYKYHCKCKGKVIFVHNMGTYGGSRSISPLILIPVNRNLTSRQIYFQKESGLYPLTMNFCGPQIRAGRVGRETTFFSVPGIEARSFNTLPSRNTDWYIFIVVVFCCNLFHSCQTS